MIECFFLLTYGVVVLKNKTFFQYIKRNNNNNEFTLNQFNFWIFVKFMDIISLKNCVLIDCLSIVHVGPHVVMFKCLLCSISYNGHMQLVYHNQLKKHKTTLRQRGLTETHDMMTHVNKYDSPISYQGKFLLDCSQNNGLLKRKN